MLSELEECEAALSAINWKEEAIVGFDTEWKPTMGRGQPRNPVALVQLATCAHVFLVRVCRMKSVPPTLRRVLEDGRVLKVGVGVSGDARMLLSSFGILPAGLVDLQALARRHGYAGAGTALATLAIRLLGVEMDKSLSIRCSDWVRCVDV